MSTSDERTISVIIPNYNGASVLPNCLAALGAQETPPLETIVVDNASTDGSADAAARDFPAVKVIRLTRNRGFAGGVNHGIAAARGSLVAVLNSDARPATDWLRRIHLAPRTDDVWAWGSVLVARDGTVESAGDHWSEAGFAHKLGRGLPLSALPDDPYPVFGPPGAAPVMRRDRLDELGGYADHFFLYYEDVDLAYRALLRGWKALLVPTARVEHDLGGSGSPARTRFYVARNSLWTAVRCSPDVRWKRLAHRAAIELRWKRRPLHLAFAELAGRVAGVLGLPRALRDRREIQRTMGPDELDARLAELGSTP